MATCPCCSNQMLRHVRHKQIYYFCRTCWQEMPLWDQPLQGLNRVSPALERSFKVTSLKLDLVTV